MPSSLVLALSLFSIFSSTPALPASCSVSDYVVNVIPLIPGVKVDHDKTRRELGGLMGAKAFAGFYTQGLTDVTYGSSPRYLIETSQAAGGMWCASVKQVNIEFGLLEPAKVHIAKEIPEQTCRYVTVLEHEMLHVAISEKTVRETVLDLQAQLEEKIKAFSPTNGDSREAATERLKTSLQATVSKVTNAHIARAELENSMIDTRASYEELTNQCPGSEF